ncbi:class D sortase [Niallia circulans]|uniref:Class D sortase n=1 Tax=Niallia circulans TaxID=1397 RepID=A0A553SNE1_NIACI|nr:class D sortase [Niallia circulans]TRZ38488.1 class D sortase [Niallia circulans]
MQAANKNRRVSKRKQWLLLSLSATVILIGVWFASSNYHPFLKGYFLYKTGQTQADVMPEKNEKETKALAAETKKQAPLYVETPKVGDYMGDLYIPKLEATLPIIHGTNEEELEKGVGHFAGSVMPGEDDNSVLSGHRDTVFRKLGEVGKGDLLTVKTVAGEFSYKVMRVRIVDKDDRTVIVPKPKATLTVTTCYPFNYIGDAPKRYILVASLVEEQLNN